MDEFLDTENILNSDVDILLNNVANSGSDDLRSYSTTLTMSTLLDAVIDTQGSILSSTGEIAVVDSANDYSDQLRMFGSKLAPAYLHAGVNQRISLEALESGRWHRNP